MTVDVVRVPASDRRQLFGATAVAAAAVVMAVGLVVLDLPWWLRTTVAFPVLLLVPGVSLTRLLLGPRSAEPVPDFAAEADDTSGRLDADSPAEQALGQARLGDPLLRAALAVLFGLLTLLLTVLLIFAVGIPIGTRSVAVGTGAVALGLLAAAGVVRYRRLGGVEEEAGPSRARVIGVLPVAAKVVLVAVVVIGAVAGAQALIPDRPERFTVLSFDDAAAVGADAIPAAPGARVRLPVVLTSSGYALPAQPTVRLTVGGRATSVRTEVAAPVNTVDVDGDPTGRQTAVVAFTAPDRVGTYQVQLTVSTGGTDTPVQLDALVDVAR